MHSISYLSACCLCCLSDSLSVCAPVEPAIKSLFQEQQLRDVEEQQESAEPEVQSATDAVAQAAIETDALEMPGGSGSMHLAASHEVVHDFPPQSEQPVQQHVVQLAEEGADISDSVPAVGFGGDDEEDDEEGDEPDDDDEEDKEEDDDDDEDDEPDDDDHQEEEHRAADHHPRRRVSRPAEDGPDRNDDDDSAAATGAVPEEMSTKLHAGAIIQEITRSVAGSFGTITTVEHEGGKLFAYIIWEIVGAGNTLTAMLAERGGERLQLWGIGTTLKFQVVENPPPCALHSSLGAVAYCHSVPLFADSQQAELLHNVPLVVSVDWTALLGGSASRTLKELGSATGTLYANVWEKQLLEKEHGVADEDEANRVEPRLHFGDVFFKYNLNAQKQIPAQGVTEAYVFLGVVDPYNVNQPPTASTSTVLNMETASFLVLRFKVASGKGGKPKELRFLKGYTLNMHERHDEELKQVQPTVMKLLEHESFVVLPNTRLEQVLGTQFTKDVTTVIRHLPMFEVHRELGLMSTPSPLAWSSHVLKRSLAQSLLQWQPENLVLLGKVLLTLIVRTTAASVSLEYASLRSSSARICEQISAMYLQKCDVNKLYFHALYVWLLASRDGEENNSRMIKQVVQSYEATTRPRTSNW